MTGPVERRNYNKCTHESPDTSQGPSRQYFEGFIVRQIEMQRGDGDVPAVEGMKIGTRLVVEFRFLAADPVVLATTGVGLVDDLADKRTGPLAGDQGRLHLFRRAIGAIDIEKGIRRQTVGEHLSGDTDRHPGSSVEMSVALMGRQRYGDGGYAHQVGLHGGRDRTGVGHVIAQVGAVVDTRDHQIRPGRQQAVDTHVDAVGGRAVHGIETCAQLEHPQGRVQRQGMTGGAPFTVRGNHGDPAQLPQGLGQRQDTGGMDAVVIGNHDVHVIDPVRVKVASRAVMAEFTQEIKPCLPDYFVFTKKGELGTFIPQTQF